MAAPVPDSHYVAIIQKRLKEIGGDAMAMTTLRTARHAGVQLSVACAVLEHESGFRNVYGHDPVRNPIKSPPNGLKRVNRANYTLYKNFRKMGMGMQGVGPPQLTWFSFQDEADALGGCYLPYWSCLVAFRGLHANITAYGLHDGLRRYNGGGAAAERYANDVIAIQGHWHTRLTA